MLTHTHLAKNPQHHLWLIHGYGGNHHLFDAVLKSSVAKNCNIFRVDLAGFGNAPLLELPYTQHICHLVQQIDNQNPTFPTVIVGHSMGGAIATLVASKISHANVKLIIVDTNLFADNARLTGDADAYPTAALYKAHLIDKITARLTTEPDLQTFIDHAQTSSAEALYYWAKAGIDMRANDAIAQTYQRINVPKCYLIGSKSFTIKIHQKSIELCKDAVIWLPEVGHWPMLDAPEVFWRQIQHIINLE